MPSTSSPLPPRPQSLALGGLDPCGTLTNAQADQLQVTRQGPTTGPEPTLSPGCDWGHSSAEPVEYYTVFHNGPGYPAAAALDSQTSADVITIAGFPAVSTRGPWTSPGRQCDILVDVADGYNLEIVYDYLGKTVPTQEAACAKATTAATMAMETLLASR